MRKVLYLEDDKNIHEATKEFLSANEFEVYSAYTGKEAIDLIKKHIFDIAILDILVPNINGLEVLQYINMNRYTYPVIILSALNDDDTQEMAFDDYADDFIIKPISMKLLLKRINVILRRATNRANEAGSEGRIQVIDSEYKVLVDNEVVNLTLTEYMLFTSLYKNKGRVFSRSQLVTILFDDDHYVSDRVIDAHIKNLRKKFPMDCIKTVIGVGYKYEEVQ
jgi:DNA-binding response OmpR family regulator